MPGEGFQRHSHAASVSDGPDGPASDPSGLCFAFVNLVEQVLDTLRDEGALSDRRFVDSYVQVRFDRRFGPLRIEAELRERGIGGGLAGEVLEGFAPLWAASASRQRHKRFGDAVPAAFEERARQKRFLQQRGFTGEQVRAAIETGPEIA